MFWSRTDPVQEVGALILVADDAAERMAAVLRGRPLFGTLPVETGKGWAVIFGAPLKGEKDMILPRLQGAIPLYQALPGWWLPVGIEIAAPERHRAMLLAAMSKERRLPPPAILVPHPDDDTADAYRIMAPRPLRP